MSNMPENETEETDETIADGNSLSESGKSAASLDIQDTPKDEERMQEEAFTIDLPDVYDIPGQEHIHVPKFNQFADTTIASDDEEGVGLFDEEEGEDDADLVMGNEADVNVEEKKALRTASEDIISEDNSSLRESSLDNRDNEGELLNEGSSGTKISGDDLDIAGSEEDNSDEEIGEEDEENNNYSLGGDDKDEIKSDEF